jgi:putative addiction module component (TIGR02574 family)
MDEKSRQLLSEALQLTERQRAELAAALLNSLDTQFDQDARAAWDAEICRRLAEIDAGQVYLLSYDEASPRLFGDDASGRD